MRNARSIGMAAFFVAVTLCVGLMDNTAVATEYLHLQQVANLCYTSLEIKLRHSMSEERPVQYA